ncbi:glycosyltransferase family 4 protein [Tessaracoccus sp. G1721]
MTPRIYIASNQGAMGGGEVMLLALARAMRELGRDVTVVGPGNPGELVATARDDGFPTVEIDGDSTAAYLANLLRWDVAERDGLLWCNGLRPAFATAGRPNRVVHLHQRPEGKLAALARVARAGALRTIVPSRSMQEAVPGSDVLWNWSDAAPTRPRRPMPQDRPITIGFLGRLSRDKGIDTLCAAMAALDAKYPKRFSILIAGESRFVSDREAARVREALARVEHLVEAPGWMERDDFFARVDLAVFPSVGEESFGLVVAEAMSAACPFVISDAGAFPEVAGADYPFTAAAGDASSLADSIERAVSAGWDDQLDSSRRRWERHFSPGAALGRVDEVLEAVSPQRQDSPRVAIAHDYLTQRGGAERVVLNLMDAFPEAPIVTTLHNPDTTYPEFAGREVITSPLNRVALLRSRFRVGLPLYGWAFDHLAVPASADVVVASTTAFAHGVKTHPGTRKIVYCHSPARFLYLEDDYLGAPWWTSPSGWALRALRPLLVRWDRKAAASADVYLCNSTVVKQRIADVYGIEATVVHPPHGLEPAAPQQPIPEIAEWEGYYLVVSRLMPYKNVDVVLNAFRDLPEERLVVIGRGPLAAQLRAAAPSNAVFLEGLTDAQMRWAYAHSKAVIAPSREDYGLTPVEGFSFGKPCLALRSGGYLDTVVEGVTGWFFEQATASDVRAAMARLDRAPLDEQRILAHADHFSPEAFNRKLRHAVDDLIRSNAI